MVGVFRPAPGRYDLVFDTPSRARAGRFRFRFWVDDTTPPSALLQARSSRAARGSAASRSRPRLGRRSGLAPRAGRRSLPLVLYDAGERPRPVGLGRLAAGRHRLVFTASDYQETKNTEDAHADAAEHAAARDHLRASASCGGRGRSPRASAAARGRARRWRRTRPYRSAGASAATSAFARSALPARLEPEPLAEPRPLGSDHHRDGEAKSATDSQLTAPLYRR